MKLIDVLNMMAKGEIKHGTKLITDDDLDDYAYQYSELYQAFMDRYMNRVEDDFFLDKDFLNIEVELIEPKPKKYQLKLYEDDDFSYVTRSSYDSSFNYDISDKNEICEFITKFTQEEIDDDEFLKFIEKYGVKVEVED